MDDPQPRRQHVPLHPDVFEHRWVACMTGCHLSKNTENSCLQRGVSSRFAHFHFSLFEHNGCMLGISMNIQPIFRTQLYWLPSLVQHAFHFKSVSNAKMHILSNFKQQTKNTSSTCAIISTPCLVIEHARDTKRRCPFLPTVETLSLKTLASAVAFQNMKIGLIIAKCLSCLIITVMLRETRVHWFDTIWVTLWTLLVVTQSQTNLIDEIRFSRHCNKCDIF